MRTRDKGLIGMLNAINEDYDKTPQMITTDNVYGIEENYKHCEKEEIIANIKPITLTQEKKSETGETPYSKYNFKYESEKDVMIFSALI